MKVTDEFHKFAQGINQDIVYEDDPIESAIEMGLNLLTENEKRRLKQYFSKVLKANLADQQLEDLWFELSAEVGFEGPGVKHVMTETLKHL